MALLDMLEKAHFLSHIEELRSRLINVVLTVLILSAVFFAFGVRRFGEFQGYPIYLPWPDPFESVSALLFRMVRNYLLPGSVTVISLSPFDPMLAQLKISMFLGVAIGMPVIVYNVARFVGPGLYRHEKFVVIKTVVGATFLFMIGVVFAYLFLLPFTYKFLFYYSDGMGMESTIAVDRFINFTVLFLICFGVVFEVPVVMSAFSGLGIVKPHTWLVKWRFVILGVVILAAVITPDGTGITQAMVAVPMIFLYFIGYFMSRRSYSKYLARKKHGMEIA